MPAASCRIKSELRVISRCWQMCVEPSDKALDDPFKEETGWTMIGTERTIFYLEDKLIRSF
jgi:hypothetical protein